MTLCTDPGALKLKNKTFTRKGSGNHQAKRSKDENPTGLSPRIMKACHGISTSLPCLEIEI
jgi:hypothetical protein